MKRTYNGRPPFVRPKSFPAEHLADLDNLYFKLYDLWSVKSDVDDAVTLREELLIMARHAKNRIEEPGLTPLEFENRCEEYTLSMRWLNIPVNSICVSIHSFGVLLSYLSKVCVKTPIVCDLVDLELFERAITSFQNNFPHSSRMRAVVAHKENSYYTDLGRIPPNEISENKYIHLDLSASDYTLTVTRNDTEFPLQDKTKEFTMIVDKRATLALHEVLEHVYASFARVEKYSSDNIVP